MRSRSSLIVIRVALVIVGIGVALGFAEAGVRVRQWWKYGAVFSVNKFSNDSKSGLRVLTPGEIKGTLTDIRINSLGFRSPELEIPKPPARMRLAFLGSSTTLCAEVSSNEATWPHLVWSGLKATFPKSEFDYVNAGVSGYDVKDGILNLEHRVKGLEPDVIVIYEAANDLSHDTRLLAREQGIYQGRPVSRSWLAQSSVLWFLVEKQLQIRERQHAAVSGQKRLIFEPAQLSRHFEAKLTEFVRASQSVAPVVAVATFSYKFRPEQSKEEQLKAANTSLYYNPYMTVEGLLAGFTEYNRVIREVATHTNAILINGEFEIPGDDKHFADSVHFTDAGSVAMAGRVLRGLTRSDKFRALVQARRGDRPS
jgi:lysophospholipase L1-like esterase